MIINDEVKKIMVLYYYVGNHFYKLWNIDAHFNWFVIHYFGQVANNNKNQVKVIAFSVSKQWQTCYKVYWKIFSIIY